MELKPVSRKKYEQLINRKSRSDNLATIDEFTKMNVCCVEVVIPSERKAATVATSLNATIKRFNRNSIKAMVSDGRVYLINKLIVKNDGVK